MTSYLIDKLEALKEDENKLKEQQRVLMEEIELEMEKKRRLELDGTIIKLRAQVDEIAKNIEGEIMPDNRMLVLRFGKHNYSQEEQNEIQRNNPGSERQSLTLEKFKDNLSKVSEEKKELLKNQRGNAYNQNSLTMTIPTEIKIYDDIIPIFTTMIGIMKKQAFEIETLKNKFKPGDNR
jgi:hypothetical protein